MITFKQLMEGYQRACVGPDQCDQISAGDDMFRQIVDQIAEASAKITPDGNHMEVDPNAEMWRQLALEGKQPVYFMGAKVTNGSHAKNEIHFLNSKRPDWNHSITV
jgi:hypothetical protein